MTNDEALVAELIPVARHIFPHDWAYHPELASAVLAMKCGRPWEEVADRLHDVPFDEWLEFARYAMDEHPAEALSLLEAIARNHHDASWRYNAARLLLEGDLLAAPLHAELTQSEASDEELIELLAQWRPMRS